MKFERHTKRMAVKAAGNFSGKAKSIRRVFAAVVMLLVAGFAMSAQQVVEYFTLDGPLVFNNMEYSHAFSTKPNDKYFTQEYLPAGGSFENYSSMFTVTFLRVDVAYSQYVMSKMAELDERKKDDPICNYMVINRGEEYMLDFLVSDAPTGSFSTVEFDVHRYYTTEIDGNTYLVLLFFSERAYGDDITDYMKNLKEHRESILSQMGTFPRPDYTYT